MTFKHIECEQGTSEWFAARLGIPTASNLDDVLASGRGGGESKTRAKYMRVLVGERMTGEPNPGFKSTAMERGNAMEPEARSAFEISTGLTVVPCGFFRSDEHGFGASPDGLIGEDAVIEIKTKEPHILIDLLERGTFPVEHAKQIQGQLWATGRARCHFVAYWPRLPLFHCIVERDEALIERIAAAVVEFNAEAATLETKLKGMLT